MCVLSNLFLYTNFCPLWEENGRVIHLNVTLYHVFSSQGSGNKAEDAQKDSKS